MNKTKDLKKGDIIEFQQVSKDFSLTHTAEVVEVHENMNTQFGYWYWTADVKMANGNITTIDDNFDFVVVGSVTAKDNVHQPSHYHSKDGIDLIEFCHQQFTEEEFRGAMKFTQLRYALRTGRKENDLQDQQKLREYADRFAEVLENATR